MLQGRNTTSTLPTFY